MQKPSVSIIVPVYNSAPYLEDFFRSVDSQDCGDVELIMVDDGSTDGSGDLLDDAKRTRPWMTVIHQENSGWAGRPRNVGIDMARGEFVFFADPDDEFGTPTALSGMVEFAREHSCDVVVPRMVAVGGRKYAQGRYKTTQIDADLPTVFTTLTPHKLLRREFLDENGIRFPEGKVRLEDGIFLSRAYLLASRVSILNDQEFYHLVHHDDGTHLSRQRIDPESYVGHSVTAICRNVEELAPDSETADRIIAELVKRKVLSGTRYERALKGKKKPLEDWLSAQKRFAERFYSTDARWEALDWRSRELLRIARDHGVDELRAIAALRYNELSVTSASIDHGYVKISGIRRLDVSQILNISIRNRRTGEFRNGGPVRSTGYEWSINLPVSFFARDSRKDVIYDLYFTVETNANGTQKRIACGRDYLGLPVPCIAGLRPFATDKRNFSIYAKSKRSLVYRILAKTYRALVRW